MIVLAKKTNYIPPTPQLVLSFLRNRYDVYILLAAESLISIALYFLGKIRGASIILIVEENSIRTSRNTLRNVLIKLKSNLVRFIYRNAKILVAESHASKTYLLGLGCSENKIFVIPHGTNINYFKPCNPNVRFKKEMKIPNGNYSHVVTYLGGFRKNKGVEYVIDTILSPIMKDILFLIPAYGPLFPKYEGILEKQKNCHLLPLIQYEALPKLYSISDIVIVPSLSTESMGSERSPNVVIEAMACGKVVIGTKVGGIPTYIGEAGILIPEKNSDAIVKSILEVTRDKEKFEKIKIDSRKWAEKMFDIEKYATTLLELYELSMKTKGL